MDLPLSDKSQTYRLSASHCLVPAIYTVAWQQSFTVWEAACMKIQLDAFSLHQVQGFVLRQHEAVGLNTPMMKKL